MLRRSMLSFAGLLLVIADLLAQGGRTYPAAKHGGNYMHNYYFPPAPGSTPWAPAWAPDGSALAIAMSGSIWTIDPASGIARELTYSRKYHSMPDWSPDGRWIVYVADDGDGTIQLEIASTATGEIRALTSDDHIYMDPVFSPDGTRLAYVVTEVRPNVACPDPGADPALNPPNPPLALQIHDNCDEGGFWTQPTDHERLTLQTSQGYNRNWGELVVIAKPVG